MHFEIGEESGARNVQAQLDQSICFGEFVGAAIDDLYGCPG
jgi:hypothetical protein